MANEILASGWSMRHHELSATAPPEVGPSWPCTLPVDARLRLVQAGEVPDPRIDLQSQASDWVATRSWWFAHELALGPAQGRRFLHLRGLDHEARILIDGTLAAEVPTASQEAWIALPPGARRLDIGLKPLPADELELVDGRPRWRAQRPHPKPCLFGGGDHNPFLANAGIIEAPRLLTVSSACLHHVRLDWNELGGGRIAPVLAVDADCWQATSLDVTLAPDGDWGATQRHALTLEPGQGVRRFALPEMAPERWWPRQLGEPRCYRLTVASSDQELCRLVGFRTVARRRCDAFLAGSPPSVFAWHPYENNAIYGQEYYKGYDAIAEAGEAWPQRPREGGWDIELLVNGVPLWISGGAVTPPTLFWSTWSAERQVALVDRAIEAGLNTLRIWGGGMLLDDAFYDACDRHGIMVHHDYLNFGGRIPCGWQAQRRQEAEMQAVARRLANHPSVVSMNGGNELFQLAERRPEDPIQHVMRRTTGAEMPHTLYHASCPVNPEVHGPWLYNLDHAARYASQRTPLNSECGVMAVPSLATLMRMFGAEARRDVFGPAWLHRVTDPGYFQSLVANAALFAPPAGMSAQQAVDTTQYVQALGYQVIFETFRQQRPASLGTIIWEFSEPWDDLNWGLISNDGVAKDALFAVRRALRPVHASLRLLSPVAAAGGEVAVEVFAHLDGPGERSFDLLASAVAADGTVIAQQRFQAGVAGPGRSLGLWRFAVAHPGPVCLALRGTADGTQPIDTEQWLTVLPTLPRPRRPRVLVVSGGSYEDHVTLAFLATAGLQLEVVHAEPAKPLSAPDPRGFDAVVLAPIFDPVSSLAPAWLRQLRAAVEAGCGLVYVGYNTSAYVSGRYAIADPQGSALEALLPLAFADDCYGNSHDPLPDAPLARTAAHALWNGVDPAQAPVLGRRVRMRATPGATVVAAAGAEPVIGLGALGAGRTIATTLPWGGHNFSNMGFRGWPPGQRLLANLVEWAATGAVAERPTVVHPFAPLAALPRADLDVTSERLGPDRWRVRAANRGAVPAFAIRVASGSLDEGASFSWHVDGDSATGSLLPGESRTWTCQARPIAGATVPRLSPQVTAWNVVPATVC